MLMLKKTMYPYTYCFFIKYSMCARTGATAFGKLGFSSHASTAKLITATPASPRRSATRAYINPESLLRRVVDNLVRELRPQQRLASHQCEHPASVVVQPID